jgi:chromosome segregation ATPase
MSDELKNKLDTFVKNIIVKLNNKEDIPEIQKEYDELIEFYEEFSILTNEEFASLDKAMNNYDSSIKDLQEQINILKIQKKTDEEKIKSLIKELEDNKELKEKFNKVNDEYISMKQKYNCCYNDNIGFQMKIKINEKLIIELQNEINNLKKENFEKFENLNELQRDSKLKERTIEELNQKLTKISSSTSELEKKNKELTTELTSKKIYYENQIITLKKQIDQLSNSNYTLTKENNEIQNQLKDFQIYTSMVKVKKTKIDEKDFSIIEIMSQRAEKAEYDNLLLKNINDELKNEIAELKKKIEPMENITLLHVKNDISDNGESNKNDFSQDDIYEIEKIKNEPKELLDMIFKLKNENIYLHNELKNITVECNQRLRNKSKKTD